MLGFYCFGDIEGFVPANQLGMEDQTDPTKTFKEGEQIPHQVIEIDKGQHKIVLSVSAYYTKREKAELDEFITKHSADSSTSFADAMPEELKQVGKSIEEETTNEVEQAEQSGASRNALLELLGKGRAKKGMFEGDVNEGELEIGQVSACIHEILPVAEIMVEIVNSFQKAQNQILQFRI